MSNESAPGRSAPPARRSFLKVAFGLLSAAIAATIGSPIVAAFFFPTRHRTVKGGGEAKEFGKVTDLPVGVPRKFDVISARSDAWDRSGPKPIGAVWLVRRDDARIDAYCVACPHLGCAIGFNTAKGVFDCPCHESSFALEDGRCLMGPSPRGLDPLPVEIKEGKVFVTYKQFVQGIATRREG